MIKYLKGDATFPVGTGIRIIAHVCNNRGTWGKGFVLSLSKRWKDPEFAYRRWYATKNPWQSTPFRLGEVQAIVVEDDIIVANMIAQNGYSSPENPIPLDSHSLGMCLRKVARHATSNGASVHLPRIGCGLGGSSWDKVEPIIDKEMDEIEVFVYDL